MKVTAIKQMEHYARNMGDVVSLSQGVPFFHSDERVREYVISAIRSGTVDKYSDPQGILSLRSMVSNKLYEEGIVYDPSEILITVGATEGLSAVLLALGSVGDEIIIPTPTYSAFFNISELSRLTVCQYPLNGENGWSLDIDELEKTFTSRTKFILLCNPNNPTGTIYSKKVLIKLCRLAKKYNIFLLLDETYHKMIFDQKSFFSPSSEPAFRKHIIRVVSFSKDYALTGWRIGYIASAKENIQRVLPYHDALVNCAPVVSQYAAEEALRNEKEILERHLRILHNHREIMKSYLQSLSDFVSFHPPRGSYFFFPKINGISDDVLFCMNVLKKERLAVVPGSDFGIGGKGHVRLCFGRKKSDIENGMLKLTRFLTSK